MSRVRLNLGTRNYFEGLCPSVVPPVYSLHVAVASCVNLTKILGTQVQIQVARMWASGLGVPTPHPSGPHFFPYFTVSTLVHASNLAVRIRYNIHQQNQSCSQAQACLYNLTTNLCVSSGVTRNLAPLDKYPCRAFPPLPTPSFRPSPPYNGWRIWRGAIAPAAGPGAAKRISVQFTAQNLQIC